MKSKLLCVLCVFAFQFPALAAPAVTTTRPAIATTQPATAIAQATPSPKRYLFLLTSHAEWWVTDQLVRAEPASRPVDGVLLMGFHNWGASGGSPIRALEQARKLRAQGYAVSHGVLALDGASAAAWTDPRTWQWIALYMLATTGEGETFAIDFEPYFKGGKYPDYSADLAKALEPLVEVAKSRHNRLLLIPGTRATSRAGTAIVRQAYIVGAILNGKLPGQVINGDESMYAITLRPTGWDSLLKAASGDSAVTGERYMPGFHLEALRDSAIQAFLIKGGWDSWYFATPEQLQDLTR